MNERIKQLMDEVIEFRLDPDSKHYEAQVSPEDLEMFAELIVQECAKVAWQHTPDTEELEYSHLIKDKILANFGVEE
jgi:hypothetical protein